MTNIKPLTKFAEQDMADFVDTKENPDEWYVMIGKAVGEYSVQAAGMPDEYPESQEDLPPEERDATENVDGFYQIGVSGWVADAFEEDCNFVGECIGGPGSKIDTRLMHVIVVHESMMSDKALAIANGEEHPAEAPQ